MTEFWPLIWEQKWWMLLPDLAYKNFTHGPPLPLFSYLLTECWGSRWSWESYVENVKALISLNSLVIAWSKASPFLWIPIELWVRNTVSCLKPLRFHSLSVNTDSMSVLQLMYWLLPYLYSCPFSKAGVVLATLWASEYPSSLFLFCLSFRIGLLVCN